MRLLACGALLGLEAAAACDCAPTLAQGLQLGAGSVHCAAFTLDRATGRLRVATPDGLCLGPVGDGRVLLLPCAEGDAGLQWAYDPFDDGALLHRATMQCLSAAGTELGLSACVDGVEPAQQWKLTPSESGAELISKAAGTCVHIGAGSIENPPCVLNGTVALTTQQPHPANANLGSFTVGGEITITAEVFSAGTHGNHWSRIVDLGNGATSDNILLGFPGGESQQLEYQVYHHVQTPNPPGIASTAPFPAKRWVRVVAVHSREGTASLYWSNSSGALELQATGKVDLPAAVERSSNLIGVSNWPADAAFDGQIRGVAIYNRALQKDELAHLGSPTASVSGLIDLCAAGPPPPPPTPPKAAAFKLDLSKKNGTVEPELYGHDLEFTRHDLFTGFSAELIANRKFAIPTPCAGSYSCWPPQVQAEMAQGFVPRWQKIGKASLSSPYWEANSSLVTGDVGHSVHCPPSSSDDECGVTQGSYKDGFDSGMSFGNAIVLQAAKGYSLRVVLKAPLATRPTSSREQQAAGGKVTAKLVSSTGATLFTTSFPLVPSAQWQTAFANFTSPSTDLNVSLSLSALGSEWWLGSVSLSPTEGVWRGMRMDVIDSLKSTGFQGLFRYPGGCYAPFYRWKIGLLEPDARPPIETPPGYCDAVAGGVNAYTDGMMENGADTQAAPALTSQLIQTQTRQQSALFCMQGSARTII
jgi:hypothetical protein